MEQTRGDILEAVGFAAERFLRSASWEAHIQEVIQRLGLAADVSRVYIFKNHFDSKGRLRTSNIFEWAAPGIEPQLGNPELQDFPFESGGFGRWVRLFQKAEPVHGQVREFPASERRLLESHGVRSIVTVPIFVQQQLWGSIGFDECRTEREWDLAELEALKAAANILGAAVENQRVKASLEVSEGELRALFEAMNDIILVLDRKGTLLQVAPTGQVHLRLPAEALIGRGLNKIFPGPQAEELLSRIKGTLDSRHPAELELSLTGGGPQSPTVFTATLRPMAGDKVILVARDVTEKRRAEEALRRSEQKYRSLFENMIEGVFQTTPQGRILSANPALVRLLGYASEEELKAGLSVDAYADPREREEWADRLVREGEIRNFESTFRRKDGTAISVLENARVVRDDRGQVKFFEGTVTDITDRKRLEAQLLLLANRDPLTNLFNRRRFHEELEMQLSQASRYALPAALLWLDLDHFKTVNDSLGHRAGDELLVLISRLLQVQVRQADVLARLGGDEFAIFMPHTDGRKAEAAATRILESFRQQAFELDLQTVRITASIGVALYPEHGVTADNLLSHADLAMYRAKEEGRDRLSRETAAEEGRRSQASRSAWIRMVREGIEDGRFRLYAQPVLDLKRGGFSLYELRPRWTDESGAVVSAESFLLTLHNLDLIRDVDRWMTTQALALLQRAGRTTPPKPVSINLSLKALTDPELIPAIEQGLAGLDPSSLIVEVAELSSVSQFPQTQQFLARLKKIGCRSALDEFGVGLTSLQHLKLLNLDFLKVDSSLIRNLPSHQQLVRAVAQLAHGLDMKVVAGGVDEESIIGLLRDLDVDLAQGQAVAPAQPLDRFF